MRYRGSTCKRQYFKYVYKYVYKYTDSYRYEYKCTLLIAGRVPVQDRWSLLGGRLCPEKLQFKEQTVDELGKANTVLQARMMIIPVGDRRLREEAGSPEHATSVYLVRQNSKFL